MIVTIHLSALLDAELRGEKKTAGKPSRGLRELLSSYGLKPTPLFPADQGPGNARIWHLECPADKAAALVGKLLHTRGVEAAYTKPQDDLPGPP